MSLGMILYFFEEGQGERRGSMPEEQIKLLGSEAFALFQLKNRDIGFPSFPVIFNYVTRLLSWNQSAPRHHDKNKEIPKKIYRSCRSWTRDNFKGRWSHWKLESQVGVLKQFLVYVHKAAFVSTWWKNEWNEILYRGVFTSLVMLSIEGPSTFYERTYYRQLRVSHHFILWWPKPSIFNIYFYDVCCCCYGTVHKWLHHSGGLKKCLSDDSGIKKGSNRGGGSIFIFLMTLTSFMDGPYEDEYMTGLWRIWHDHWLQTNVKTK